MRVDNTKINLDFVKVDRANITVIMPFARRVWAQTYKDIISQDQIDFMLGKMYSESRITQELEAGYIWELVMLKENLIGYIDYRLEDDHKVFLSKIYLDPTSHSKGVGMMLLSRVLDFAKGNKAVGVYLTVNKENEKAISFYERNGFYKHRSEVFDIGEGYVMDDYVMQLDLL